ncbi:TerD family protein [Clostridioides difficile]|uniref:TerD family protein n=1 Tax=Clostridioides difficile TaxID=1496 RepID=UPI003F8D5B0C
MGITLAKGQKVSLTKSNPGLKKVIVGLGWDINKYDGGFDFDLDASAFLTGTDGKVTNDGDFIFYNNLKHASGAVEYMGDNRTGVGDGDDEQIIVNLEDIPEYVHKIVFGVSIYKAKKRDQDFGQMNNSFIRLIDSNSKQELFKYNLQEDFSGKVTVLAGEIYRRNEEWKFNALGIGQNEELRELINTYK